MRCPHQCGHRARPRLRKGAVFRTREASLSLRCRCRKQRQRGHWCESLQSSRGVPPVSSPETKSETKGEGRRRGAGGGGAKRAATGNGAAHRSNGLPVRVVGHVARREHPSDGCRSGSRIGQLQVSVGVLHGGEGRRCFLGRERLPFSAVLLPEVCTMASSAKKPVFGMCPTWSKVANLGHDIASGHSSRCPEVGSPGPRTDRDEGGGGRQDGVAAVGGRDHRVLQRAAACSRRKSAAGTTYIHR